MDLKSGAGGPTKTFSWSGLSSPLPGAGGRLLSLLTPRSSWVTFSLLFLTLLVVVWSVEDAGWVATPSLAAVTFLAMATAALLARWHVRALPLHALGVAIGMVVVLALTTFLVEPLEGQGHLEALFQRLWVWGEAAVNGGISSDTLPFGLALVAAAWASAYLSAWFAFRRHSIWGGIVPGALGLLTNLSYLPQRFFFYFFLYIVAAMLLVAWMNNLSRGERRLRTVASSWQGHLLPLVHALWIGLAIVILAASLPVKAAVAEPFRRAYGQVHQPVELMQGHFNRLFSGVPGRKDTGLEAFGSALPFQGSINLGEGIVFTARSPFLTYWAARAYDTYTSQGWPEPLFQEHPWGWTPSGSQAATDRARLDVSQEVIVNVDTSIVVHGGIPQTMDQPATWLVHPPSSYTIDLQRSSEYQKLPPDLRLWAQELREAWLTYKGDEAFRQALTPLLLQRFPQDTLLLEAEVRTSQGRTKRLLFEEDATSSTNRALTLGPAERLLRAEGRLSSLEVVRAQPSPPDLVALRVSRPLALGTGYQLQSSVSVATEPQLTTAGTAYPRWVTDRYLRLPDSLPARVRQLAEEITMEAATPYEKAALIMDHLRHYDYSVEGASPPYNADGVDYFLLTQRKGYSDYFASAMAVMLRAVGVPTRLVAGYGPGTWEPEQELIFVRDSDRHTWPEVFFPGYGWVVFEPTPIYEPPVRGVPVPLQAEAPTQPQESPFVCEGLSQEECEELLNPPVLEDPAPEAVVEVAPLGARLFRFGLFLGLVLGGVVLLGYVIWQRGTRALGSPERAYEQMRVLAALAHLGPQPSQTPYEFGRELGARLPSVRRYVQLICDAYVRTKYGRQTILRQEGILLDEAWRRVRGRVLRRVLHLGAG